MFSLNSMFHDVIRSITNGKARSLLVVDRHRDNAEDRVQDLKRDLEKVGFEVGVNTGVMTPQDLHVMVHQKSIFSIMNNRREATILAMDTTSKKMMLPKKLVVGDTRVLIIYMQTHLQKLPYAKKLFDVVHIIQGIDMTNTYVAMAMNMVMGNHPCDVEEMLQHDITMLNLVLMQNIHKSRPKLSCCIETYKTLVAAEMFANNLDDSLHMANIVQANALLAVMKRTPPALSTKFDFTQHLSRYSVQSSNKRKQIESSVQLKIPGLVYEEVLLHTDISCKILF